MRLLDALLGGLRWYRRLRGGRWEYRQAICACPIDHWQRPQLFTPRAWPAVLAREDYR